MTISFTGGTAAVRIEARGGRVHDKLRASELLTADANFTGDHCIPPYMCAFKRVVVS